MYQEEVMGPMGDWVKNKIKKLSETDKIRDASRVGSGFGENKLAHERQSMPNKCAKFSN